LRLSSPIISKISLKTAHGIRGWEGTEMTDDNRMKVKVCLVGESAVGKTSLVRRFVLDEFDDRYISTLGTKVSKKEIIVEGENGHEPIMVDLTIWDIMGEKGLGNS
jgi:GTPase SAR1 family protein